MVETFPDPLQYHLSYKQGYKSLSISYNWAGVKRIWPKRSRAKE